MKRVSFFLNDGFPMAILDLFSRVYVASFVIMQPKYFKYSTFSIILSIVICMEDGCLEVLFALLFFKFISIPQHIPISDARSAINHSL